uniref:Nucleoporin NUP35 n=1 Tax=Ascaris lumbricoides TaxID=6252 RepID=A0A9J2PND5_ASCLU
MLGTHNIRDGIVDRSMFVDSHSRNSPFGFTSDDSLQNQPTTPNFLFGSANKRRSLAIPPSHSYQGMDTSDWGTRDDSNLFASAMPSHLPPSASVNKGVHWSPALVHVEGVSPRASTTSIDTTRHSSSSSRTGIFIIFVGPPLRSIRDELKMASAVSPLVNASVETTSTFDDPMEQSPVRDNADGALHWVIVFGFSPEDASRVLQLFSRHGTVVAHRVCFLHSCLRLYSSCLVRDNADGALHWVIVFGFSPEDASRVLQLFSRHGTVVAHRFAERGNWVYIRYSSIIHAQQALSRNGRIIDGCLRLGVIPIDPGELASLGDIAKMDTSSSRAEESTAIRGASSLTPLALKSPSVESRSTPQGTFQSIGSPGGSSYRLRPSSTTRPAMRSLSAAYNAADNQFNINGTRQPLKDQGLLQKLWNYLP